MLEVRERAALKRPRAPADSRSTMLTATLVFATLVALWGGLAPLQRGPREH